MTCHAKRRASVREDVQVVPDISDLAWYSADVVSPYTTTRLVDENNSSGITR